MELETLIQALDKAVSVSLHANPLGKVINPSVLPSALGK